MNKIARKLEAYLDIAFSMSDDHGLVMEFLHNPFIVVSQGNIRLRQIASMVYACAQCLQSYEITYKDGYKVNYYGEEKNKSRLDKD